MARSQPRPARRPPSAAARALGARLAAGEQGAAREVARALRGAEGHHGEAARALGVSVATLYRWLSLDVMGGVRLVRLQRGERR